MPRRGINAPTDERIRQALAADGQVLGVLSGSFPGLMAVYVFGSQVQGTANPDSDLDLAILVEGYADAERLWGISSTLANAVGCEVDLVDLRHASTVLQYQVLTKGIRLWAKEPAVSLFEAYVCSEKLSLDEARAALVADVVQGGSVYGR
ncbi:MAG: nucleotidyltransferase domain-containing protein [Fibrobacteres bacterium]|jgi:predicted nucleotidyltransferase|nr:nucleotidyltransferase domain-containing protein [Fibrobacterota bacterium]